MEAATVPSRTVEVEAAELASYVASLPRLLAENLTVEVKGGTVSGYPRIKRFYGPGSLTFKEKESGSVSFTEDIEITSCDVPVYLEGLTIRNTSGWGSLVVVSASHVELKNCVIDRVSRPNASAFFLDSGGSASLIGCTFKNSDYGLNVQSGSIACVQNCTGSGNGVGCFAWGGVILLAGSTPELMGGTVNKKSGGIIAKKDGTLL